MSRIRALNPQLQLVQPSSEALGARVELGGHDLERMAAGRHRGGQSWNPTGRSGAPGPPGSLDADGYPSLNSPFGSSRVH